MFEKLWGMLQELESAKGSKAKTALLQKFVGDKNFVWMAKNALDQGHSFGVDNIPDFQQDISTAPDVAMVEYLENLKENSGIHMMEEI